MSSERPNNINPHEAEVETQTQSWVESEVLKDTENAPRAEDSMYSLLSESEVVPVEEPTRSTSDTVRIKRCHRLATNGGFFVKRLI